MIKCTLKNICHCLLLFCVVSCEANLFICGARFAFSTRLGAGEQEQGSSKGGQRQSNELSVVSIRGAGGKSMPFPGSIMWCVCVCESNHYYSLLYNIVAHIIHTHTHTGWLAELPRPHSPFGLSALINMLQAAQMKSLLLIFFFVFFSSFCCCCCCQRQQTWLTHTHTHA